MPKYRVSFPATIFVDIVADAPEQVPEKVQEWIDRYIPDGATITEELGNCRVYADEDSHGMVDIQDELDEEE